MSPLPPRTAPDEEFRNQDFPALARLQLGDEDLRILTYQGFLSRETRRGKDYFKLRFRRDGNQHVKYVSAGQAAAVHVELEELQGAIRLKRNLAAATRAARQALRQTKRNLQPVLTTCGLAFHGLAIRRRRGPKRSICNPPPNQQGDL
jgi:hypothetical protein